MKKIIIALGVLGCIWTGAQAQTNNCVCRHTKNVAAHKKVTHAVLHHTDVNVNTQTYQVCRYEGGYYTCCLEKNTVVKPVASDKLSGTTVQQPLADK